MLPVDQAPAASPFLAVSRRGSISPQPHLLWVAAASKSHFFGPVCLLREPSRIYGIRHSFQRAYWSEASRVSICTYRNRTGERWPDAPPEVDRFRASQVLAFPRHLRLRIAPRSRLVYCGNQNCFTEYFLASPAL
jgi:hypothetical protein